MIGDNTKYKIPSMDLGFVDKDSPLGFKSHLLMTYPRLKGGTNIPVLHCKCSKFHPLVPQIMYGNTYKGLWGFNEHDRQELKKYQYEWDTLSADPSTKDKPFHWPVTTRELCPYYYLLRSTDDRYASMVDPNNVLRYRTYQQWLDIYTKKYPCMPPCYRALEARSSWLFWVFEVVVWCILNPTIAIKQPPLPSLNDTKIEINYKLPGQDRLSFYGGVYWVAQPSQAAGQAGTFANFGPN